MPHQDPLTIFLKLPPLANPIAVLGLSPGSVTDLLIIEARARRLVLVDQHPLAWTPDADEARLAIHAAAAQLLQQTTIHRHSTIHPAHSQSALPSPKPRLGVTQAAAALERDTLLLVGMAGGWSPRVLTRLAAIAITRGLTTKDAVAAASRLARRPSISPKSPPPHTASRSLTPTPAPVLNPEVPSDEAVLENWIKAVLVLAATVGVTLTILVLGAVWAINTLNSSTPASSTQDSPSVATIESPSDRISPPRSDVHNAELVFYELTAAQSLSQTNRSLQAVARIEAALGHWLDHWPSHDPATWRRVLAKLIPLIESVRQDPTADAKLAQAFQSMQPPAGLHIPAERVSRFVALAAILGSLDSKSPSAVSVSLESIWSSIATDPVPAEAIPAANAALLALSKSHLENNAAAYTQWADAAEALSRILAQSPTPLLLAGASELLARIDPPTLGERNAIAALLPRLDWRSGAAARSWLLQHLNDRTVHPQRMSVAIHTLATRSSAPGIATSLTLSPQASWDDRFALAQSLGEVWDLEVALHRDLFLLDWLDHADSLLALPSPRSQLDKLDRLGQLAYLNASATLSLQGQDEAAVSSLSRITTPVPSIEPLSPIFTVSPRSPLTLVESENDPDKLLSAIQRLNRKSQSLSHADAATLVELAFRSRHENIRTAAADAIRPIASSPQIILAALELSPLIVNTAPNRALLSVIASDSVTQSVSEEWHDSVHRILARSLLSRTSSRASVLDATTERLRAAYASAATTTQAPRHAKLTDHARALANQQLASVSPTLGARRVSTPAQIASLRDTRLRVAHGPIQRFAIEQFALASATAISTTSNSPSLQGPVESLWQALLRARANAASALDQALVTERTIARIHTFNLTRPPESTTLSSAIPQASRRATSSRNEPSHTPATSPDLSARLLSLTPSNPAQYLDLADELRANGREQIAIHAYVIAATVATDRGDLVTAASSCLALMTLTDNPEDQDLLRSLAETLNPRLSRPGWLDSSTHRAALNEAELNAARALLDLRRAQGDRVLEALRDPATAAVLEAQPELRILASQTGTTALNMLAQLARNWPCQSCNNDRTTRPRGSLERQLCTQCNGHPGPRLADQAQIAWLSIEVRLLSPEAPWSSAIGFQAQNDPIAQPGINALPSMFSVDASKTVYRNGGWARP